MKKIIVCISALGILAACGDGGSFRVKGAGSAASAVSTLSEMGLLQETDFTKSLQKAGEKLDIRPFATTATATVMNMKIYKVAVSTSVFCTSPIVVAESIGGVTVNMAANPNIFRGEAPNGTYPCVIIEFSDNISYTPNQNAGSACTGGTSYTRDLCRSGNTSKNMDGTTVNCSGSLASPVEDHVTVYISTATADKTTAAATSTCDSNQALCDSFTPPTAATGGYLGERLEGALEVNGSKTGIFIFDTTDKIVSSGSDCDMNPPRFGFQ